MTLRVFLNTIIGVGLLVAIIIGQQYYISHLKKSLKPEK